MISNVQQAYPIAGASLKFAHYLIENKDVIEKYSKETIVERNNVCDLLLKTGKYDVLNSNTNFIHIHEKNNDNSTLISILNQYKVACKLNAVVPGDSRKTWVRLSIGPEMINLPFFEDML
jgi:histidinol-phosphate/aromatic aminotransferase/cobyric acid decarboxylase-like protein